MGEQTGSIEDGFPMDYYFMKFHQVLNYRVADDHCVGFGFHLDHFFKIRENALQINQMTYELTPHFIHSRTNGFDTEEYTLSGESLSYVYDSRDNPANAYRGNFANINY